MDTVYSKKKGSKALLVLTERLTRKEIIERMPDRAAESAIKALDRIERRYGAHFRKIFRTITVPIGGEGDEDCKGRRGKAPLNLNLIADTVGMEPSGQAA